MKNESWQQPYVWPFCPAAVPALRWICRMRSQTVP